VQHIHAKELSPKLQKMNFRPLFLLCAFQSTLLTLNLREEAMFVCVRGARETIKIKIIECISNDGRFKIDDNNLFLFCGG
jgi:hypothetical protein